MREKKVYNFTPFTFFIFSHYFMLIRSISSKLFFTRQLVHTNRFYKPNLFRAMSTNTMRAVYIEEQGGVDKLLYKEDVPVPKVTADSVLIKNHVIGVNFIDTYHRSGIYPVALPYTLGKEGYVYFFFFVPRLLVNDR
jgi:hypothetical protein